MNKTSIKPGEEVLPPTDRTEVEPLEAEVVPENTLVAVAESETGNRQFNGINIGGNTVTSGTEHLPEDHKLLVRWLHSFARENKWTWETLQAATGIEQTAGYRIFTGKYRYAKNHAKAGQQVPLDGMCARIRKFKALADERKNVKLVGFLETIIWEKIDWGCKRALHRNKMVFVYGESHIGKSRCLRQFAHLNNGGQSTYVEMPPSSGVQLMCKTIARALHVSTSKAYDRLLDDIIAALDPNKLLIIDEVHRVFTTYQSGSVMRCLDVLRYIYDQTGCGMVLCGTNVFRNQLKEGDFFQYLKQLLRRGLYQIQLPDSPPASDLDLLRQEFHLPQPTGLAKTAFHHVATQSGFGALLTRLQDGAEVANKKGDKFTWDHFLTAHNVIRRLGMTQDELDREEEAA